MEHIIVRAPVTALKNSEFGSAPRESRSQPTLIDPPEVVLLAIHERHRDLLGESRHQIDIYVDLDTQPGVPRVSTDLGDRLLRNLAEVTVNARIDDDPCVVSVSR